MRHAKHDVDMGLGDEVVGVVKDCTGSTMVTWGSTAALLYLEGSSVSCRLGAHSCKSIHYSSV